jgi:hypothetical protein
MSAPALLPLVLVCTWCGLDRAPLAFAQYAGVCGYACALCASVPVVVRRPRKRVRYRLVWSARLNVPPSTLAP